MAQSKERYKVKITEEHIYEFKVYMILKRGRNVLALVIRWLNPDFSRNYVREYFEIDKYGMKNIKKVFNRGQINTLLAFEDEAKYENSFDISLLCRLVQIFCLQSSNNSQPVKDCLQAYLNNFKSIRNSVAHENLKLNNISFLEKIVEIKHNLIGILRNAAQLYNAEDDLVNKLIIELINDIDIIRDSPNLDNLKDDAFVADLKKTYTRLSYISPSSNVFWDLSDVRVSGVFTEMKITTERKQSNLDGVVANTLSRGKDENVIKVDYIRLLDVINERQKETNNSNMAVLIEGPAGVGKTTLTRQIISDWSSETRTMLHLTNYDYVILSECRENNITSLFQLLVSLMPNSSKEIQQEIFMENFEGKKLLFIVDGVHELTSSSEEVLRQILKMGDFSDIVIIYTSHPNQSKSFKSLIPDNFDLLNLEIHGIDKTYQEEFVIKYCKAMYNESEEESKVLGLLNYLRRKSYNLQDELKIPFNLILLIILWFSDSHAVNRLTSVTELFVEMHKINQRKLEARLFGSVKTRHLDSSKTSNKLKLCLKLLYREALISHMQHNKKGIDEDSVQRLRCHCENLKLSDKVLSAFLVKEPSLRDEVSQQFCFPHKGMQDFYSALYIFEELKDLDISEILVDFRTVLQDHSIPADCSDMIMTSTIDLLRKFENVKPYTSILSVMEKVHQEVCGPTSKTLDLPDFQNVFIHLTELMHLKGNLSSEKRVREMITLFKESGIKWLFLLLTINCNEAMAAEIASMMDLSIIRFSDKHVYAYEKILKYANPACVVINIHGRPQDIPLEKNFKHLKKSSEVQLHLHYEFQDSKDPFSVMEDSLRELFQRCRITRFTGLLSISAAAVLPDTLQYLGLSITDTSHYKSLEPFLSYILERLPKLEHLWLHMQRVDVSVLKPLPPVRVLEMTLSNITGNADADWASDALQKLHPTEGKGYHTLKFPEAANNIAVCEQLICCLAEKEIKPSDFLEISPRVGQERHLVVYCEEKLRCPLEMKEEESIWDNW